ncbi:MAG: PAS domain S-box protein [Pseudomonadota bacterium]
MVAELKTAINNNKPQPSHLEHDALAAERVKIKIERHTLLLRGAPVAICVSGVNALITLAVVWGKIDPLVISAWAGSVFLLALVRLASWAHAAKRLKSAKTLIGFTRFHIAAMAINGALWGALAPMFAVSGLLNHAFLPFMCAGMTAAAIASAGASWKAVMAFNVPVLTSLAVAYGILLDGQGLGVAAVVVIYAVATAFLARGVQSMVTRSIKLRSRNDNALSSLARRLDDARDSEKRFRALVESSTDVTLIFSPEGEIVYASPSVETALGAPAQMIVGKTMREIVHPKDVGPFRDAGGRSLSKIGEVLPLPHVCLIGADGAYRDFAGRLTNMLYVPGVEGFVFNGGRYQEEVRHAPRERVG